VAAAWAVAVTAAGPRVPRGKSPAGKARPAAGGRLIAEEQAALRRVAVRVAQGESPEEIFAAVAAEAGQVLHADQAYISRYDPDGTASFVAAWTSGTAALIPVGTRLSAGGRNLTALIFQTGQPARMDDYVSATGAAGTRGRESGIRSAVGAPVSVAGRLWGALAVASTRGPLRAGTEARLASFAELAATAIANAQARIELRSFAEEQAALRRVATLVARAAAPEQVFAAVTGEAGRLFAADIASLSRYAPDGTQTAAGVWDSTGAPPVAVGTRLPLGGRNVASLVFQTGRPARMDGFNDATGQLGELASEIGIRTAVGVPVSVAGELWGGMFVVTRSEPLPADTEERLAAFAELVATAIANAEAQAEVTASRARIVAAADQARRRIERDLHDGTQQRLVTLALKLRVAQAQAPPELGGQLEEAVADATGALDELRETARGIHPAILTDGGLRPALKTLAGRCPVPVDLQVRAGGRFPEPVETSAYYIVAEALTNAAKHARASAVSVEAEVIGDLLRVTIRDDGAGGARLAGGTGLAGLKDRVEALGGRIVLHSPRGAGTSLRAELPLTAADSGVTS
jgi:signal transduction histidine kinase